MQYRLEIDGKVAAAASNLPFVDYMPPRDPMDWNGLVLVGEAPGKEEVRLGKPFVGRSGQLLNEILGEAGIDRSRCLVANVFRYQPPGNKVDHFFASQRAAAQKGKDIDTNLGRFGSQWCLSSFASEIKHLKLTLESYKKNGTCRMILVALGRTPFWALTGENGLLTKTGQRFDCRLLPETAVIPTFHPSFILRGNWGKRPEWLSHFIAAAQHVARK